MGSWLGQAFVVAFALMLLLVLSHAVRRLGLALYRRLAAAARRPERRSPLVAVPEGRPIEVIAREARRLGHRFRQTRHGVSFAKAEGVRRAYEEVLAEACDALGLPHLLTVLAGGSELDAERQRVERLLHIWGIELDSAA
jgi:predicted TIM-barrel fold metal-dependent hydrolase